MTEHLKTLLRYGGKYRIKRDECNDYYISLRGDRGHIYAHSEREIAAYIKTFKPSRTFKAINRKCPLSTVHVMGDEEIIILYPVSDAEKFLSVCRAKTKKRLTDENKQRLQQAGRQFWFKHGDSGVKNKKFEDF